MRNTRVFVGVVGFSDVERHALNTVFRLSEDRGLTYEPWPPPVEPGASASLAAAQVLLVDGESAEAVMAHARELPTGQRLIWVGAHAPRHAWRVLERPMVWSELLDDLDAVYAAHQVDSGLLDLDVTSPAPLTGDDADDQRRFERRALLVGVDAADTAVLRAGLAQAHITEIDAAFNTDLAVALMGRNAYGCAVFNLDEHQVDAWALARLFATRFPQAKRFALSHRGGGWLGWWQRRRVLRNIEQAGMSALLARPLRAGDFTPWIERI